MSNRKRWWLFQVQRKFGHKAKWWREHEDLL